MLKTILHWFAVPAALLLGFAATARAAAAVDPSDGPADLARMIYDALAGGHKAYAAAIALVMVVALVRKYLGGRWQWMHSNWGAALLVLLGSFGAALATSLAAGGPLTWSLAWTATLVGFGAIGGYTGLKKLIVEPLLIPLDAKMAASSSKLLNFLALPLKLGIYWFEHASDPSNQPAPAA